MAGLGRHISIVYCSCGVVLLRSIGLQGLVLVDVRIAHRVVRATCGRSAIVVLEATMLLSVDVGDVRRRLVGRRAGVAGLLTVSDEVLEVLHCRHG